MGRLFFMLLLCALLLAPLGGQKAQNVFFSQLFPQLTPLRLFGEATPGEAVAL